MEQPLRTDRFHTKKSDDDQRTDFQRDRDRVLYSIAFRRLAGVTQVVHAAEGHTFHNRLTHSLKVAQLGRRMAEYVTSTQREQAEALEINADVVETAGLAHDLGHPPFGHIAEDELDALLHEARIPDGFEGNAQTFRVITKVAVRRHERGLDLTRASLNAVLKYPWDRKVAGKEHKKWGSYYSETDEFKFARALWPSGDKRQCAEAALMDWADDVSYAVHDVDDFYCAGLVPLDQLITGTVERDRFLDKVLAKWSGNKIPGGSDKEKRKRPRPEEGRKRITREGAIEFFEWMRRLLTASGPGLFEPFSGSRAQQAALKFFSSTLIRRYIMGADEVAAISLDVGPGQDPVRIDQRRRVEIDLLKEIMPYYIWEHPALVAQQYGQRKVIRELFTTFLDAAKPTSRDRGLIPEPFSGELVDCDTDRDRARIVADLIGGLAEQQALLLHQRLTGTSPGSVRDIIVR